VGLLAKLLGRPGGGPLRVVLPPASGPALRRELEDACREYAAALGVRLPALVVEAVEAGGGRRAVRPSWERMEGRGGLLYRLVVPLRDGRVAAAELRELLLAVLADAGAIVRGVEAGAAGDAAAHGPPGPSSPAPSPAPAVGERVGEKQEGPVPRVARRVPRRVWQRWRNRGWLTDLELPSPAGPQELPELAEALARRRLELVEAVPFPATGPAARLDAVGDLVLAEPELAMACLRAMGRGVERGWAFVMVPAPEGMVDRLLQVGQALAGVRLAAGAMREDDRVYLRLPTGIDRLGAYLHGGWLERAAVRAVVSALGRRNMWAGHAATRARVRLGGGEEMELDVLVLTRQGAVVWAECALNLPNLVQRAPRRRLLRGACFLPGDVALAVCAQASAEEAERVRRAYGWPVWLLGQGRDALLEVLAGGLGPSGDGLMRAAGEQVVVGR